MFGTSGSGGEKLGSVGNEPSLGELALVYGLFYEK